MQGLISEIKSAGEYLIQNTRAGKGRSALVLSSTQNIYQHYIGKSKADDMTEFKASLMRVSDEMAEIIIRSKDNIKQECFKFFRNRIVALFAYWLESAHLRLLKRGSPCS